MSKNNEHPHPLTAATPASRRSPPFRRVTGVYGLAQHHASLTRR